MATPGRTRLTIDELLTLLRTSEDDQLEVARQIGVTTSAITCRVKKHLGIGVLEYRQQHGWAGRGVPPSKVQAVREAYLAGKSQRQVAADIGISVEKVIEILGDQVRTREEDRALVRERMIPAEEMEGVVERYYAGASCVELAKVYDCSERTIRRILDAVGVKRRTRGIEAYNAIPEATRHRMAIARTKRGPLPIGVCRNSRVKDRFYARITYQGKLYSLGGHDTAEAAGRAYDAKARELWGSDARLNYPLDQGE